MTVRWSARACANLESIRTYIAEHNPDAATRVGMAIFDAAKKLERFPAIGRPGRAPGTRELPVLDTPYLIIYMLDDILVEIITVIHGAQRWPPR